MRISISLWQRSAKIMQSGKERTELPGLCSQHTFLQAHTQHSLTDHSFQERFIVSGSSFPECCSRLREPAFQRQSQFSSTTWDLRIWTSKPECGIWKLRPWCSEKGNTNTSWALENWNVSTHPQMSKNHIMENLIMCFIKPISNSFMYQRQSNPLCSRA